MKQLRMMAMSYHDSLGSPIENFLNSHSSYTFVSFSDGDDGGDGLLR